MTMVVIGKFKDGAVIISDSRASYNTPGGIIPNDSLQKILPIGKNRIFCYSGSVSIANKVLEKFRTLNEQKKEYQYLDGIIKKMPGLLKFVFENSSIKEKELGLSVVVGGKMLSGDLEFWAFHHSKFTPKIIGSHYVIGTGEVVRKYLDEEIGNIKDLPDLKNKADKMIIGLSSELSKYGIESIGGMFQIVLLSKSGIQILKHGFINMNPENPPESIYMNMENGNWIQQNLSKGQNIPIVSPSALLTQQACEKRVLDYASPDFSKKEPKWYLNYFLTSIGVCVENDKIEFHRPVVIIGSYEFPIICKMIACLGFWGGFGTDKLKLILEKEGKKETIKEVTFNTEYFPEGIDLPFQLSFSIESPGPVFLEAMIRDKLLARRVLYFGKIEKEKPKTYEEKRTLIKKVEEKLQANLIDQVDLLVENGKPQLVYFFLCQDYKNENNVESFINDFWISYWKKYPLTLNCYIASAFRMAKGRHNIRIDLVNASNYNASVITNTIVNSISSCLIIPIHGRVNINIPESGYYFINTYIDKTLITSYIFIAETDMPKYSYDLKPEDLQQVKKGGLIILAKRSKD